MTSGPTSPRPITLVQLFQHYRGQPHQTAALYEMEADLRANGYEVAMSRARPWFATWSYAEVSQKPPLQQQGPPPKALLKVPYFSQMDNSGGEGWRECASSSCAMLAAFWRKVSPDSVGETAYIELRKRFGETTDPMAHVAALRELGLTVDFRTTGTAALLRQELAAGRPVAVGWLHHGPVSAPSGGGHWSVVIGYGPSDFVHHDPFGEANLLGGGYVSTAVGAGRSVRYSATAWLPRWVPKGADGWMITARPRP